MEYTSSQEVLVPCYVMVVEIQIQFPTISPPGLPEGCLQHDPNKAAPATGADDGEG